MIIVVLGAPGSGKGTIAKLLQRVLKVEHISTGDMFREEIKTGSSLGKELSKYMKKGELVPDDIVIEILEKRLERPSAQNGVVLDGFPRTKSQAKYLKAILNKANKKVDIVIKLTIPDEDIIYRTVKRRICSNNDCRAIFNLEYTKPKVDGICDVCGSKLIQRADDNEKTITERLKTYHEQSHKILHFYERENIVYTIHMRAGDKNTEDDVKYWMKDFFENHNKDFYYNLSEKEEKND